MIIDYDTGLFDETTVRRFADVVQNGFASAFDHPGTFAAALAAPAPSAANDQLPPLPPEPVAAALRVPRASPRTLQRLSALWRDQLGTTPQGPGTDFFDMGGNSMGALRMCAKIEAELGVRIPIAAFFDDPTLGGIAFKIDALLGTTPAVAADDGIWNLIALREADASAPLIVSVNQPFLYHGMARALGTEAEVINLHVRDMTALEGPDAEVLAELVDAAASRVAERAAGRRLVLIGHCVDGTMAFLIARQLVLRGLVPELVYMIDTWAPDANAGLSAARLRARRLGAKARRWGQDLRQLGAGEIGWTEFLSRNKITRPFLEGMGRVPRATDAERQEWAVNARLVALVRSMSYAPYAGPVALFTTAGQHRDARSRLFGWTGRLPPDTPIYDLPGRHEHALKQHGVKTISAILGCRLGRGAA